MIAVALVSLAIASAMPQIAPPRRERLATDIAMTAPDVPTALAMVATARAESDARESVERCAVTGDSGAAISIYQVQHFWFAGRTRAQICASNRVASEVAANALGKLRQWGGSWESAFVRYVGAKDGVADPRVARRLKLFRRLMKAVKADA